MWRWLKVLLGCDDYCCCSAASAAAAAANEKTGVNTIVSNNLRLRNYATTIAATIATSTT